MFSSAAKRLFRERLGNEWVDLCDVLGITPLVRNQFRHGDEGRAIWEWLETRHRLGDLPTRLKAIDRHDLADDLTELLQNSPPVHNTAALDTAVEDMTVETLRYWRKQAKARAAVWSATAALAAVFSGIAINQVLDNGRLQWPWLAVAVVVSVTGGVVGLRLMGPATDAAALDTAGAERTLAGLATAVEALWRPEQGRRRLLNPRPLSTAWTTIGPPISDHWANIRADGINEPLDLSGMLDLTHTDAFYQTVTDPRLRGRIVLLGDPGAGKTALLIRVTLTLLATRTTHHSHADPGTLLPVPVLLRLSTWNPDEQTLEQWLTTRLETDYGRRRPVPTDQLIPLLDGLDEMPQHRRRQALLAMSNTFTDSPLVLTSRTTEYLDALTALTGNTLAAAAVLELTALPPTTVRDYLQFTTARPTDWADVFTRDAANHDGRLADALSAPLWVDLARTTYTDPDQPDNDPAELLLLPDTDAIHGHLLDRLIPTAYPDPPEPSPDGHTWRRDDAHRWLRQLAADMHHRDTQDLAWWKLTLVVPRPVRLAVGAVLGLTAGLTAGLAAGLASGFTVGLTGNLVFGLAFGLAFGLTAGLTAGGDPPPPSRRQVRWRRTGRPLLRRLAVGLALGLAGGLAFGLTVGLTAGLAFGLTAGDAFWSAVDVAVAVVLGFGLPGGLGLGLVAEFTTLIRDREADIPAATDPLRLLREDRRRAVTIWLAGGLAAGLAFVLGFGHDFVLAFGRAFGLALGLAFGLAGGLMFVLMSSVWWRFEMARVWWCGHRWLPWHTMAFLSDAHRRGILRQAGGVWQFRHALLRDRLATTPSEIDPAQRRHEYDTTSEPERA
jgi:hypothetical protein